jgi:hypothetical protein
MQQVLTGKGLTHVAVNCASQDETCGWWEL